MTSSTISSSRWLLAPFALAVALATAPAGAREAAIPRGRVALLPIENLTGTHAPLRDLRSAVELALARQGIEVVSADGLERFLARHRIRYTGGVDRAAALAAGEELGVQGLVVTTLEFYGDEPRPALALNMRLVSADERAEIRWIDGVGRIGDDSPGLLGLGLITSMTRLRDALLPRLARSLAAALDGRGPGAPPCPDGRRFKPRTRYRAPGLQGGQTYSVAVVPFRNLTKRRAAGEVVALEFARQMAGVPTFRVIEPGVVRDVLLRSRIVMEGGVSLEQVRAFVGALEADLIVAGDVIEFGDTAPNVNFTATVLDGRTGKIVWQSTSFNRGDDGVFFFDLGRVSTATVLSCRMIRGAVEAMVR